MPETPRVDAGPRSNPGGRVAPADSYRGPGDSRDPARRRTEGHVIHCDAHHAFILAEIDDRIEYKENYWAVGQMISIQVGENRVIGQTARVVTQDAKWNDETGNRVVVHVELVGEVMSTPGGMRFTTGISGFPKMGCIAHRIRSSDLAAVFENNSEHAIRIGHVTQDPSIDAKIDYEKLMSRHFAVVGSTGVGKSTAVTLMLRKVVTARPDIRVLLLDPHNEFGTAFPDNGYVLNASRLVLPFWLFTLEEIAEVIFRGQGGIEIEKEMLRDLIVAAKLAYLNEGSAGQVSIVRSSGSKQRVNADTPSPYRIVDLLKLIDERTGKLDNKSEKPHLKSLRDRVDTITNDARFQFMFDSTRCGGDRINDVIAEIFRVPHNDRPICVLEMSGLPSEVVSSVVSVLCRLAFDLGLASDGAIQTLVVCEEAHRYIPADHNAGFWPTRMAIGRIAKEGQKYGAYLGIITQRPSELDPTILSQCNSFFAMRLSNKRDQEIIAGAFNSGAQSTIAFLPSISNRECIAFGEAVYSPMRMTFETVEHRGLPGAHIRENQNAVRAGKSVNLSSIVARMRGTQLQGGSGSGDDPYGNHGPSPIPAASLAPQPGEAGALDAAVKARRAAAAAAAETKRAEPVVAKAGVFRPGPNGTMINENGTVHSAGSRSASWNNDALEALAAKSLASRYEHEKQRQEQQFESAELRKSANALLSAFRKR